MSASSRLVGNKLGRSNSDTRCRPAPTRPARLHALRRVPSSLVHCTRLALALLTLAAQPHRTQRYRKHPASEDTGLGLRPISARPRPEPWHRADPRDRRLRDSKQRTGGPEILAEGRSQARTASVPELKRCCLPTIRTFLILVLLLPPQAPLPAPSSQCVPRTVPGCTDLTSDAVCGILGLLYHDPSLDAAQEICEGLALLQHRGQDACGIVTCGPKGRFYQCKANGMVRDVFDATAVSRLVGGMGVGHGECPSDRHRLDRSRLTTYKCAIRRRAARTMPKPSRSMSTLRMVSLWRM